MVITWFGLSSLKITSGPLTLVTDPFSKTVGLTPPRVTTDVALISNPENLVSNNIESLGGQDTFVIDGPGEFDVKNLFVRGVAAEGNPAVRKQGFDYTSIYAVRMEDIRLGFLGSLQQKLLTDGQLQNLGEVDVLFVPVGGNTVCDAEAAVTIVNQIEPAMVVPLHYAQPGLKLTLDKVEQFLKEIGSPKVIAEEKLTLKKSNFLTTTETTEVHVLLPQR